MKKEDLLVTRLRNYGKSDQVPCHMPGHKRNQESWLTFDFPNPFSIDITEIDGFDNLHHPEGILKESMEWASEVYGIWLMEAPAAFSAVFAEQYGREGGFL